MTRRLLPTVFWAATWAVGVAVGVALGAWLTVVGGAGTPGVEGLDPTLDLLVLPALSGLAVFVLYLLGHALLLAVRPSRRSSRQGDGYEQE